MTYCISDIHGEYDRYLAMLQLIDFSDSDCLYVLGDAIDRCPNGVDVLLDIMRRPNVHMIVGNHEDMCLATLGPDNIYGAKQLWIQNGGNSTRIELLYHRSPEERHTILNFLTSLPDHLDIEVNGRLFHLVHGYPADNREDRIWSRPEVNAAVPIPGKTVIVGHTPTVYLVGKDPISPKPYSIWYGNGIIDIDCGAGNETTLRRLACLRLEDMQEFYV